MKKTLPQYFWVEAVNTACYVLNRVLIRPFLDKTPYERWKNKKPNIGYFKVFGCKCFILNTKKNLGKFDSKSDIGIFLGYSSSSKAYRVFNKRTLVVEESMHVIFDESNPLTSVQVDIDDDQVKNGDQTEIHDSPNDDKDEAKQELEHEEDKDEDLPKAWRYANAHPKELIIGEENQGVKTRSSFNIL